MYLLQYLGDNPDDMLRQGILTGRVSPGTFTLASTTVDEQFAATVSAAFMAPALTTESCGRKGEEKGQHHTRQLRFRLSHFAYWLCVL